MLDRIRICLPAGADADVRKMFGLDAFVCRGLMFAAVIDDDLVVRLESSAQEEALALNGAGSWTPDPDEDSEYIRIPGVHVSTDEILRQWIARAYDYTESLSSPHLAGVDYGDEEEPPEDLTGGYSERAVGESLPRAKKAPSGRPPVRKIPVAPVKKAVEPKAAPKKPAKKAAAPKAAPKKPAKKAAPAKKAKKAAPKKAKKAAKKVLKKKTAKKVARKKVVKKAARKPARKLVRKAAKKPAKKAARKAVRKPARKAKAVPKKKGGKRPAKKK